MTTCGTEREDLSRLLDGELDDAATARVSAHAEACAGCGAALAELLATRELLRSLPPPEPTADFERHLLEKIRGLEGPAVARPPTSFAHRHPFVLAVVSSVTAAAAVTSLNFALFGRVEYVQRTGSLTADAATPTGPVRAIPVVSEPLREPLRDHVDDTYAFVQEVALRGGSDPERDLSLIEHDIEVSRLPAETGELLSRVRRAELPAAREEIEDYLRTTDGLIRVIRKTIDLPGTDPRTRVAVIKEATRRSRIVSRLNQVQVLVGVPAATLTVRAGPPAPSGPGRALPRDELALYKTARRAWFAGDLDGAVSALRYLESEFPRGELAEVAHFWIGNALQRSGRLGEAQDHLRVIAPDFAFAQGDPFVIVRRGRDEPDGERDPAWFGVIERLGEDLDFDFHFGTEEHDVRVQAGAAASVRGVRVPRARIFAGHRGADRTASIIRSVVVNGQRVEVGDDPEVQVIFRDVEGHVLDLIQGGQAGQRVRIEVVTSPTDPETTERRAVLERPVRLPPQLESRLRRLRERLPDLPDLRDLRELQLTEERLH